MCWLCHPGCKRPTKVPSASHWTALLHLTCAAVNITQTGSELILVEAEQLYLSKVGDDSTIVAVLNIKQSRYEI